MWPLLETEEERWNVGRGVDIVLGLDLTYDKSMVPVLMATLTDLLCLPPDVEVCSSVMPRNEQTFLYFSISLEYTAYVTTKSLTF